MFYTFILFKPYFCLTCLHARQLTQDVFHSLPQILCAALFHEDQSQYDALLLFPCKANKQ